MMNNIVIILACIICPIAMTKCLWHCLIKHGPEGRYHICMLNFRFGIECMECGEVFCDE